MHHITRTVLVQSRPAEESSALKSTIRIAGAPRRRPITLLVLSPSVVRTLKIYVNLYVYDAKIDVKLQKIWRKKHAITSFKLSC